MAVVTKRKFKDRFPNEKYIKKSTHSTAQMYRFYHQTFNEEKIKYKISVGDYGRIRSKFTDAIGDMICEGRTVDLPYGLGKLSVCYYNPVKPLLIYDRQSNKPRDVYEWWKMKHIFYDSYLHLYFVLIPMKTLNRKINAAFLENPKKFMLNDL